MKTDATSILNLAEHIIQVAKVVFEKEAKSPKKKTQKGDNANVKRT
jgi:hypothetical protein